MRCPTPALLLVAFAATACGSEDPSGLADDLDVELPIVDLRWQPCPLITGETGADAECATTYLPKRYDDPGGPGVATFLKRRRAAGLSNGQLWLLNGGPGASVVDFEPALDLYSLRTDLDFYFMYGVSYGTYWLHRYAQVDRVHRGVVATRLPGHSGDQRGDTRPSGPLGRVTRAGAAACARGPRWS